MHFRLLVFVGAVWETHGAQFVGIISMFNVGLILPHQEESWRAATAALASRRLPFGAALAARLQILWYVDDVLALQIRPLWRARL